MQAVQFGAGKIGRGFLGQLLFEGGYRTTFIDADTDLVDALNGRGEYPLWLVSETETQTLLVKNLCALEARRDRDKVTQAIVGADLICVAVGANVLPHVAPALAAGLNARASAGRGPIDVLLCENQWHAASLMRGLVAPHIAPESSAYFETQVGLVETVIGRMVPTITEAQRAEDPLLIVAEPYKELPIARAHLRGEVPSLPGLIATDDFEAYEARKLYLHNMSHAALAYVGHLRSHKYVWQCAADSQVAEVCREALGEVVPALAAEYGFSLADLTAFAEDLLGRFANRALGDTVGACRCRPAAKAAPGRSFGRRSKPLSQARKRSGCIGASDCGGLCLRCVIRRLCPGFANATQAAGRFLCPGNCLRDRSREAACCSGLGGPAFNS